MEHRTLGHTGIKVSPLCLGAMMFGAWGNPDHDDTIRIIHRALDAGINFVDTADVYSRGRVGGDRRQGAGRRPARRRRARHQGARRRWATTPTSGATRAAGSRARSRTACAGSAPTGSTSTRSTAPTRHRHRRDARRAHRPRPRRQGARDRQLDVPGRADRRGPVGRRAPRPRTLPLRAAAVLDPRARHRGDVLPTCQRYGMGVIAWSPLDGGWLSGRCRKGTRDADQPRQNACRSASTSRSPPTGASSTPSTSSPSSPTRRASR